MARRDEYGPLPEKSRMWKLATGEFVTLWWAKTHQHRVDWYISKRCQVIAAGREIIKKSPAYVKKNGRLVCVRDENQEIPLNVKFGHAKQIDEMLRTCLAKRKPEAE